MTAIRMHYGASFRYGTGWLWGNGVTDPWVPKGTPDTFPRFSVEQYADPAPNFTVPGSQIYAIANTGVVTKYLSATTPTETFYVQSPGGQWWQVATNGVTGMVSTSTVSGPGSPIGFELPAPDGRLWTYLIKDDGTLFLQTPAQWFSSGVSDLYAVDNTGLLYLRSHTDGTQPDEVFWTQSPNGLWWQVTLSGTTGTIAISSASSGQQPIGKQLPGPDGRLWTLGVDNGGSLTIGYAVQAYTVEPSA